jgi:hypothetical protein
LWCIRSRQPGIARALAVLRRPLVLVVGDPDPHAAPRGAADRVRDAVTDVAGEPHVVECEVERLPRGREPGHDPVGDGLGGLAAIGVRADLEHGRRRYPGR